MADMVGMLFQMSWMESDQACERCAALHCAAGWEALVMAVAGMLEICGLNLPQRWVLLGSTGPHHGIWVFRSEFNLHTR